MSKLTDHLDATIKDSFIHTETREIIKSTRAKILGVLRQAIIDLDLEPSPGRVNSLYQSLETIQPWVPPTWVVSQAAHKATRLYNVRVQQIQTLIRDLQDPQDPEE